MGLIEDGLKLNDFMSEARKVFDKIKLLEQGHKDLVDTMKSIDKRLHHLETDLEATKREIRSDINSMKREIDADLRVVRSEAAREAGAEARSTVNAVQSSLYDKILDISLRVDRLKRDVSDRLETPQLNPPK